MPRVQAIRSVLRRQFPTAKLNVTVGRRLWWGGVTLDEIRRGGTPEWAGTPSMGVVGATWRHALSRACHPLRRLRPTTRRRSFSRAGARGRRRACSIDTATSTGKSLRFATCTASSRGDVDLPCFPLFGLFNAAMGVTTVIPRMDFSRPASVDPPKIVEAVEQWHVTQVLARRPCGNESAHTVRTQGIRLNSLRRVMSAGAPVPLHACWTP